MADFGSEAMILRFKSCINWTYLPLVSVKMCESGNAEFFDVVALHSNLKNCLLDGDDIHLDSYLEVYKNLMTFCNLLGSIFKYVKDEIQSKSEIICQLKFQQSKEFKTVKGMVRYEKECNLLNQPNYISGCRTLLRLHWGFDFIRGFLRKAYHLNPDDGTSSVAREVYDDTLSSHHAWYIKFASKTAMSFLPTRNVLMEKLCGGTMDTIIIDEIPLMLQVADEVYQRVESVYHTENLLGLD